MNTYLKRRIKELCEMVYGKGSFDKKSEEEYQIALNNIKGLIKANKPILKESKCQMLELYYNNDYASIKAIASKCGTYNRIASNRIKQGNMILKAAIQRVNVL